jgi:hypothetical protein
MTEECKIESNAGIRNLAEIQKVLQDKDVQYLINGSAGAFSIRLLFLDGYLNYAHHLEIDPSYNLSAYPSKGLGLRDGLVQINKMMSNKCRDPVDILFISRNRQVTTRTRSGYLKGDYIFYSVISELQNKYPHVSMRIFVSDDIYDQYYQADFTDLFVCIYNYIKKFMLWKFLSRGIARRLGEEECGSIITYAAQFFHPRFFLRSVLKGYSIDRMLERASPKVIVCNDDCFYTKPLGQSDSKVVVLQSARMAEHIEICRKVVFQEEGLKPDYFLASGDYFKDLKEKGDAAVEVIATGLPRYDMLGYASEIYSRSDFLQRHGIDPRDKIILWSTQSHSLSNMENDASLRAVFGALKETHGVTLVIKQHPAEPSIYTEMFKKRIEEDLAKAILVPGDSDTYELLFVCDLMITKNSTTAMEAVALNKPVIVLNLSGQPDLAEYVEEGVALGIYEEFSLKDAIRSLLEDDYELAVNRNRYVEKYLYRIDGKATKRVVKVILDCLHETSKT